MIKLRYQSIDGFRETKTFATIQLAQGYAQDLVGPHPEMGSTYAVSGDGVGKVTCEGCTLQELFPAPEPVRLTPGLDEDGEASQATQARIDEGLQQLYEEDDK